MLPTLADNTRDANTSDGLIDSYIGLNSEASQEKNDKSEKTIQDEQPVDLRALNFAELCHRRRIITRDGLPPSIVSSAVNDFRPALSKANAASSACYCIAVSGIIGDVEVRNGRAHDSDRL